MSVLGKPGLLRYLKCKRLVVSPIISNEQVGACSIDIRMGTVALLVRARGLSHVDPAYYKDNTSRKDKVTSVNSDQSSANNEVQPSVVSRQERERGKRQKLERHDIPFHEQFLLHPGMLALVPTYEWFVLPNNLKGVVTARSSWAREGLNIATANFINPNYVGIITLELANFGQIPIKLYPGLRIAQIAFHKVDPKVDACIESQFDLSFEPKAGDIVKYDEPFIPDVTYFS